MMRDDDPPRNKPPFLTVKQFCATYPWPTEPALRWMLFNSSDNRLDQSGAVIRVGTGKRKRILIDPEKYWAWIRRQGQSAT